MQEPRPCQARCAPGHRIFPMRCPQCGDPNAVTYVVEARHFDGRWPQSRPSPRRRPGSVQADWIRCLAAIPSLDRRAFPQPGRMPACAGMTTVGWRCRAAMRNAEFTRTVLLPPSRTAVRRNPAWSGDSARICWYFADFDFSRLETATGADTKLRRHPVEGRDPFALLRAERSRRCVWVPACAGLTPWRTMARHTPRR